MRNINITGEVRKLIADKIASKETVRTPWIMNEVMQRHADIEGEDKGFYLVCARAHLKNVVRACIGKYDAASREQDTQIIMAGFDHLQIAYSVERHNETVLVPVDMLTDEELLGRAAEYDTMARGCKVHAKEIRKYVQARAMEEAA